VAAIARESDLFGRVIRIPGKLVDIGAEIEQLETEACLFFLLIHRFQLFLCLLDQEARG